MSQAIVDGEDVIFEGHPQGDCPCLPTSNGSASEQARVIYTIEADGQPLPAGNYQKYLKR